MRSRLATLAVGVVIVTGCAGGQFHVDPGLRHTPVLAVEGPLGFNAYECAPARSALPRGIAGGQPSVIEVGELKGTVTPLRRDLTTTPIFSEALLRDYEAVVGHLGVTLDANGAVSREPVPLPAAAKGLLGAIRFVLALPASVTETAAFGFIGHRGSRSVIAACTSTDTARILGFMDGPRFTLRCRFGSSADERSRELSMRGYGTWTNYGFLAAC